MNHYKSIARGVFYCHQTPKVVNADDIQFLYTYCKDSRIPSARICFHPNEQSVLMQMLIVNLGFYQYPPHKHPGKPESYTVLDGTCNFNLYDDFGQITSTVRLEAGSSYLNDSQCYHALLPLTSNIAYLETTIGPFIPNQNIFLETKP